MKTKKPKQYEASSIRKSMPSKGVKEPQEVYSRLKGQDLHELAARILKLIGEDKQKRATLIGLLVQDVATKQEFITILAQLKTMQAASDKRFEAIESELKAMRADSDKKFQATERRFEAIDNRFEALDKSLSRKLDTLGSRWGIMAEDTFTRALSEILSTAGFQVSKWRKTDSKAEFFMRPRDVEIDILIKNGKRIAIEVKSALGIGDIEMFEKAVQFYEKSESIKIDEKIMVGIHLHREVDEYAKEFGIKIISDIEDVIE